MKGCIVIAIALLAGPAAAEEAAEDFRVVAVVGEVAVVADGASHAAPAAAGLPISAGDRIVTGKTGRVEVAAKNGTVIRLEENASLAFDDVRTGWVKLRVAVGRFLARFERSKISRYQVSTPVAVASVRGTELAIEVADDGAVEAGVIEGEVSFEPETSAAADPSWAEEVVVSSQGLSVPVQGKPLRMNDIPRPLVRSLAWFPDVRSRVPRLRETWKDLDAPSRRRLRQAALRDRIRWELPPRLRQGLRSPRERVPTRRIDPARPARPQRPNRREKR